MDSRIEKMAEVLINYSTAVRPGELVLIRGTSPAAEPLAQALYQAALRAGGQAEGLEFGRDQVDELGRLGDAHHQQLVLPI